MPSQTIRNRFSAQFFNAPSNGVGNFLFTLLASDWWDIFNSQSEPQMICLKLQQREQNGAQHFSEK